MQTSLLCSIKSSSVELSLYIAVQHQVIFCRALPVHADLIAVQHQVILCRALLAHAGPTAVQHPTSPSVELLLS